MDDKTQNNNPEPKPIVPAEPQRQEVWSAPVEHPTPSTPVNQPPPPPLVESPAVAVLPPVPLASSHQPSESTPLDEESSLEGSGPLSPRNIFKLAIGIFAVLALAIILFIVVIPNLGKEDEKVTLSYWGVLEDSKVMQPVIAEFETANPGITVQYQKQDVKDYRERLATRISQGTGPDIFSFQNTWYPVFSQTLLPLPTETISKDYFNKSFYPVAKKDLIVNGGIYGIPLGMDTLSLFVNTEIFSQGGANTPKNWDDFVNVARSLTVKDQTGKIKTSGVAMGTFDNVNHAQDIISLLFIQDGVNLDNLSSSTDRVADALRFYAAFAQGEASVWDATLDPSALAFSKGNLAMYFGYYWDYFAIKSQNPTLAFRIDPVPQLNFQSQTVSSYWAEGVSAKSKNQKAALLFMKFLASRETAEKLYQGQASARTYGQPPAIVGLADKLQNSPVSATVLQARNATSSYFAGEGLDKDLTAYLSSAINSVLSGTAPDTAADALISGASQALSKY